MKVLYSPMSHIISKSLNSQFNHHKRLKELRVNEAGKNEKNI